MKNWALALLCFLYTSTLSAVDIVSFFLENCNVVQGVVLEVSDNSVIGFDIDGRYYQIDRAKIKFLSVHRTVNNPISRVKLDSRINSYAKEVYVGSKERPDFIGWPVRYADDLVIFHDTKGNTHVLDLYKIKKIREVKLPSKVLRLQGEAVNLNLKDAITSCPLPKKRSGKEIQPTRLLADNVQISEMLDTYQLGFQRFKSYEERTFLYAKPYLYEKDTRMGYLILPDDFYELHRGVLPVYFQWATGSEYRFQSFSQIGGLTNENAPTFEPFNGLRSDVKSHLFHASFIGNAVAVSAGSEYFTGLLGYKSTSFDKPNKFRSVMFFNYMALMGIDYGPWSFSVGPMYPIYFFKVEDQNREVLASSVTPVFRLMHTTEKLQWRVIFSTQSKDLDSPNDLDLAIDPDISTVGQISSFRLNATFIRAGFDYYLNKEFSFGGDLLFLNGDYEETLPSTSTNRIEFRHQNLMLRVSKRFGDYVRVKFYGTLINLDRDIGFSSFSGNKSEKEYTTGGAFEFIF